LRTTPDSCSKVLVFSCQLVDPSATPQPAFRQQPGCEQAPDVRIASSSGSSYDPLTHQFSYRAKIHTGHHPAARERMP
jgi:hypothetical protein